MNGGKYRVAMYSPGMVGFGHIRRNASIALALRRSALQPVIVMIAEARQAGALPMPEGVDSVTLPALRKEADGWIKPRFLDIANEDLIALRAKVLYTGYLDQRPRLNFAETNAAQLLADLPKGRFVLCAVGGGHDGAKLADAFVRADLPADTSGVVVTGPYMSKKTGQHLRRLAE